MGGGLGRVTNHTDYYLSDGSVSFLTGKTLFRVHRSFFTRESAVFRDLFAHATEEDPQSGTDARPFTLDVKPEEFAQLLWVWYDKDYSYKRQTKENWVTVLRLSTRWEFPKIRELAIRELDGLRLSPAERITIYNEYGIDGERLLDSYVELCRSPVLPTEDEARLMQMETLINVLQAREDAQRTAAELGHESPTSACLGDETLREIVSRYFKTGLNLRPNGSPMGSEVQASDLNGAREASTNTTILLGDPQVPDRRAQSANESHADNSVLTGSEGKGSQGKVQENQADSNATHGKAEKTRATEEEDKKKLAQAAQDKEKERKEKLEEVIQAKERGEAERAEKARQAKVKDEELKAEKAKQAREKEEKERIEKARQEQLKEAERKKERGSTHRALGK